MNILNIITDSVTQNPATSGALQNLMQSHANDFLNLILTMLCTAAFISGSVTMFTRNLRQATRIYEITS